MFEKMVESRGAARQQKRTNTILAAVAAALSLAAVSALLLSLFSQTLAMGEEFELTNFVMAPAIEPDPEPATNPQEKNPTAAASQSEIATRRDHIARILDSPREVPESISTIPSSLRSIPVGPYRIGSEDTDPPGAPGRSVNSGSDNRFSVGDDTDGRSAPETTRKEEPTPAAPPPLTRNDAPKHVGVVNGKAISLPKPDYPEIAKRMGLKGTVKIQVLIDKFGNVISANALEGNPILVRTSIIAANRSKFSPTLVGNSAVSVRGVIIYNFK